MFEAVTRLLAFLARERPTVLILDDLQWADASTALLLGHLLRDVEAARLFVLGTFREGVDVRCPELPALLGQLAREPSFERIDLGGLDSAETGDLVASYAERRASDSFVLRLCEGTEGNPFFVKETMRSLAEAVAAGDDLEHALAGLTVPAGVKELVESRLARVSGTAQQVLTVASVVGREFRLELLEELIDEPVERIIAALEEAGEAGLVDEVADDADRFVFPQALVRDTLYERQSGSRRVRLHHRIAQALEELDLGATPAELALHFHESRHLDRAGQAVGYSVQAAERAAAALAYEEAATHYRRALDRFDGEDLRRCELLLALGGAEARAGDPRAAGTFDRVAELARDRFPEPFGQAALGGNPGWSQGGAIDRPAIARLEEALAALGDGPLTVRLLARLANLLHFAGETERVNELSARAVELARRMDDVGALIAALESRHSALFWIEHLDERLRLSQELLELAERIEEPELQIRALHWRAYDLLEAADADGARRASEGIVRLAARLRQPAYSFLATRWELLWTTVADRVNEVEPLIVRTHEFGTRASLPEADVEAMAQRLAIAYRHRAMGSFAPSLAAGVEQNPHLAVYRPVLALAHLQAGDRGAAAAEFERLADFDAFPRDTLWFSGICVLAEVCASIEDMRRAAELYRLLLPYRRRHVVVGMASCFGSCERYLGLLASAQQQWDVAEEHFEAALASNAAAGIVSMLRMTRDDYRALLEARAAPGDAERAEALRAEALEAAELPPTEQVSS